MAQKFLQVQKLKLAGSGLSLSDTTLVLQSFTFPNGTEIVTADLGTTNYMTLEPGTDREEIISFLGANVTQNSDTTATITSITRGLKFGTPYTADATLQYAHAGGSIAVMSNNPQMYEDLASVSNDEVITGYWTAPTPLSASGLATKSYVDGLVSGGTVSYDKIIETGTAGETVAIGNLVYLKAADGRWWKADADLTATIDNVQLGIAQGAGTAGNSITGGVLRRGVDTNQSGGAAGGLAYAGNTAGAVVTSTGTLERVIGNYKTATSIYFDPAFYYVPTALQKAQIPSATEKLALAGSLGTLSASNKFITQQNTSIGTTDQTQSTRDTGSVAGEADATGKRNLLAQSFIPTITKISGVKLYKDADTGTFTGTVKIALQADTTGSPSGSDLASFTFTNAQWLALTAAQEFFAIFTTEYASLTVGNLYWIVITTSTADNSNHPNFGVNSVGGYASGSAKYKNITDGWVAIATIDLYFKTVEGVASQIVKTGTDGKIPLQMFQPMRNRVYVYTGTKVGDAATSTVTITHALGFAPSYIRAKAQVVDCNNSNDRHINMGSEGTAIIAADGTVTYNGIYWQETQQSNTQRGGITNAILKMVSGTSGDQTFTITKVSEDTVELTITKNSTPTSPTIDYILEIFI